LNEYADLEEADARHKSQRLLLQQTARLRLNSAQSDRPEYRGRSMILGQHHSNSSAIAAAFLKSLRNKITTPKAHISTWSAAFQVECQPATSKCVVVPRHCKERMQPFDNLPCTQA
jgi:hypothetical protein